jgi:CRISP-associated protein Cas1
MKANLLLVIDHRETQLTLDGRALKVTTPGVKPRHVPLGLLGLVVVHGRPLVGCDVWRALAERQIPAVLQPARGQGASAWMGAALGSTIALRTAQHRAADRPECCLSIARRLVTAKVAAQARAAEQLAVPDKLAEARQTLRQIQDDILSRIAQAQTIPELMGREGAAAAAWFRWLAAWLPPAWGFQGRQRRPPRDPVNALLSLGYTLLGGDMLGAVQQQGLDPARGLLHSLVPGRESLVLDLIEPLRASVDLMILGLLDRVLTPADFTHSPDDGCRLDKDARGRFYQAWALARQDWPNLLPTTSRQTPRNPIPPATVTLPQMCRQQVDWLRLDLKPFMPALEVEDDDPLPALDGA